MADIQVEVVFADYGRVNYAFNIVTRTALDFIPDDWTPFAAMPKEDIHGWTAFGVYEELVMMGYAEERVTNAFYVSDGRRIYVQPTMHEFRLSDEGKALRYGTASALIQPSLF